MLFSLFFYVCEHQWVIAGEAYGIKLQSDRQMLPSDGHEIAHIEVSVVDAEGIHVPNHEVDLTFHLTGAGAYYRCSQRGFNK
ncbi:hypothetical protein D3C81_1586000 [compost metagenome]